MVSLGLESDDEEVEETSAYLLKKSSKFVVIWELMMSMPMWYTCLVPILFFVWPGLPRRFIVSMSIIDGFFLIDFILNLFKANEH